MFSCEFCEISKSTFSYRTPLVAASVHKSYLCSLFKLYAIMRDKISFCKYDVIILEFRKGLLLCKKIKQKNLLTEVFCKKMQVSGGNKRSYVLKQTYVSCSHQVLTLWRFVVFQEVVFLQYNSELIYKAIYIPSKKS